MDAGKKQIDLMKFLHHLALAALCFLFVVLCSACATSRVKTGAELLLEQYSHLLKNKRIGIICNHTSVLPNGTHLVDTLLKKGITLTTLFSPEHGIRGMASAGETVHDTFDVTTGLRVFSLYGTTRKPTREMLNNVDVLLFDLQDVGARFYTYISTMVLAMEAAAENGKQFIVLDRPNPINGVDVEGPVLDTAFKSFVGMLPIPLRHGMTVGEIAKMVDGEWLMEKKVDLTVIPMEGWKRSMWYDETGLPWIAPSPNMKTLSTATVYAGTCLFEATNISEGRGTEKPFEYFGAPWLDGERLSRALNEKKIPGGVFSPLQFTPQSNPISALNPKYKDTVCNGVWLMVEERTLFQPVRTTLLMLDEIKREHPDKFQLKKESFDRLAGTSLLREGLENGAAVDSLLHKFKKGIDYFKLLRERYLLYK